MVGDLWSVPAYLRRCAPGSAPTTSGRCSARTRRPGRVSDLPLLDAARQRLGDPEASRRRRRQEATIAAERERMSGVIDELIATDDSELLLMTTLRHGDLRDALVDEAALPTAEPDLLAGPFAHIVVDEAQELTDAEWQMLLLRCPSRSFTIVGDRAQARHGFTESWQERLERVGLDRINLASLTINYRTPEEVMAEAEPVIRAVLPDANVPTSIRSSGVPVVHGSASELRSILDTWLAEHAEGEGIACVIGDPTFRATARVRSLTPELVEGARVRPRRPRRPRRVRHGHRRSGRPLRRDDPGDPAARGPHELLTSDPGDPAGRWLRDDVGMERPGERLDAVDQGRARLDDEARRVDRDQRHPRQPRRHGRALLQRRLQPEAARRDDDEIGLRQLVPAARHAAAARRTPDRDPAGPGHQFGHPVPGEERRIGPLEHEHRGRGPSGDGRARQRPAARAARRPARRRPTAPRPPGRPSSIDAGRRRACAGRATAPRRPCRSAGRRPRPCPPAARRPGTGPA